MKRILILLLAACLLIALGGCRKEPEETVPTTVATEPQPTTPPDGNPEDVTCLGTYSRGFDEAAVVAKVGDKTLTNGQLNAYYWAAVAAYRENGEVQPDYSLPLDVQACPVDDTVASWQQFFLKRALDTWHGAAALILRSEEEILPTEEAYQPDMEKHEAWLTGKPATQFLYGYNDRYQNNTMHQAFLDAIPEKLGALAQEKGYDSLEAMAREAFGTSEADLISFAKFYNQGYMYFTFLGYDLAPDPEEAASLAHSMEGSGKLVDIRHIQTATEAEAKELLQKWQKDRFTGENLFGEFAVKHSLDAGSASTGGLYRHLKQGQLPEALDSWCFDPARVPGDTTILSTADGFHILYFSGSTDTRQAAAERELTGWMERGFFNEARAQYPLKAEYSAMGLGEAAGSVTPGDILYPDIAHERFPEIPLYIQNDYGSTRYGRQLLSSHGCGICCFAMMGTYMTDTVMTPPELAAKFGRYCAVDGTDATMFVRESSGLGFYFREKINDYRKANETLKAGYPMISVQFKGMWTRGGHYILLESMTEDDIVKVRDSSLKNYGKLEGHEIDAFTWKNIITTGMGCWVFEKKVVSIPSCTRCGEGAGIAEEYLCQKCEKALIRREAYLEM